MVTYVKHDQAPGFNQHACLTTRGFRVMFEIHWNPQTWVHALPFTAVGVPCPLALETGTGKSNAMERVFRRCPAASLDVLICLDARVAKKESTPHRLTHNMGRWKTSPDYSWSMLFHSLHILHASSITRRRGGHCLVRKARAILRWIHSWAWCARYAK